MYLQNQHRTSRAISVGLMLAGCVSAEAVAAKFGFPPNALQARKDAPRPAKYQAYLDGVSARVAAHRHPQARAVDDNDGLTEADLAAMPVDELEDRIAFHQRLANTIRAGMENSRGAQLQRDERRLDEAEGCVALFQAALDQRQSRGRRTTADEPSEQYQTRAQADAGGRRSRGSVPAQPRDRRDERTHGFGSDGEFFAAVAAGSMKGATADVRLYRNAAPNTFGSESVGQDGGFAVPPDFRTEIVKRVLGEDSLLSLTDKMTTSSNQIVVPTDETTPWQQSGGIQAYWESEGGLKSQSKPQLTDKSVKLNKIICLVPMTDELLEDAPAMASYVNGKAPEKIDFKVNDAIVNGTGIGQPLGFLNSPALVTVAKESGQVAGTIVFQNIVNMFTRLPASSKRSGVWLVNADAEAQLMTMQFPGTGTAVPAYLPPGGLSASPYGTLMGRPVIVTEAAAPMGSLGDIMFVDLRQYMSITKASGIKQDVSIHVWFDYDITAFRFVLRVGGQPWWNTPILRPNGLSRSPFVALAPRA